MPSHSMALFMFGKEDNNDDGGDERDAGMEWKRDRRPPVLQRGTRVGIARKMMGHVETSPAGLAHLCSLYVEGIRLFGSKRAQKGGGGESNLG